jgi:hypothetical protein
VERATTTTATTAAAMMHSHGRRRVVLETTDRLRVCQSRSVSFFHSRRAPPLSQSDRQVLRHYSGT